MGSNSNGKDWKSGMKKPFWLSHQRCGFIFLYDNTKDFELIALASEMPPIDFAESAKGLIDNLEEWWCINFLEALRDECTRRIEEDKKHSEEYIRELNKMTGYSGGEDDGKVPEVRGNDHRDKPQGN